VAPLIIAIYFTIGVNLRRGRAVITDERASALRGPSLIYVKVPADCEYSLIFLPLAGANMASSSPGVDGRRGGIQEWNMATDNKFTVGEVLAINDAVMHKNSGSVPKLSSQAAEIVRRSDFSVKEIVTAFQTAREHVETDL
jgi:hypothetical protein